MYRQEHGLTDHRWQMIEAIERYKFALSTFSNLQTEYERIIQANRPSGKAKEFRQPSTKSINQLWFDVTIRSNTDDIAKFRALPYDQYLSTEHWCRLRAAVFLIHRAVCQEKGHFEMGESWYFEGWETDIDVHHLNFENRGNERYSDIALLCHEHHEMWCNNIRLYRQPKLEIADEEEY